MRDLLMRVYCLHRIDNDNYSSSLNIYLITEPIGKVANKCYLPIEDPCCECALCIIVSVSISAEHL